MLSSTLGTSRLYIGGLKLISVEDAKVLARTSRVVRDESKLLMLGASLDQIVAEGMDSAVKPCKDCRRPLCQSKSKGTSGGVWIATAGGGLWCRRRLVAGVLLNNVGDPRLHERRPTLSSASPRGLNSRRRSSAATA